MKKILTVVMLTALMLALATSALAATGLGSVTSVSVTAAEAEKAGSVAANTTMCAVTLDDEGKIVGIKFDVMQAKGAFDAAGAAADFNAAPQTKKELKEGYGMVKASAIGKEWYEQAAALEAWCIGKTVDEVLGMPTFDRGDGHHTMVPDDADLKTGCTITVGDYLKALEKAAADAK
ncbi:MAG: hypothetical protein ACI4MP_01625 [Candidatus Ventricola sp.]